MECSKRIMRGVLIFTLAAVMLLAVAAAVFIVNDISNRHVGLTRYSFESKEIPFDFDNYKILLITDLHNADFSEQILKIVHENQPDMVLFCGDFVQLPYRDVTSVLEIVGGLSEDTGVYAVSGDHESQNWEYYSIMDELYYNGVRILDYKNASYIERGSSKIRIIGFKDPVHPNDSIPNEDIADMQDKIDRMVKDDPHVFNIFALHRAALYPYFKDTELDLILSGDAHGGIVRLPLLGGLIDANGKLSRPRYTKGVYKDGKAQLIVSRGCDRNYEKMRIFNPPEVVLITLNRSY